MKRSYIYLLLTILFWSATPAVAKLGLVELDNFQFLFYAFIIGVISLSLVTFFQAKTHHIKNLNIKDYLKMFAMGAIGIFLYNLFAFGAFIYAPAGQVSVINYIWPIFVIILSIPILKERYNWKTIISVLISFSGVFIVFTRGNILSFSNEYTLGYSLAAIAALCYGLFSVLGKKLHYEKYTSMLVYHIFGLLLIIPATIVFSEIIFPHSLKTIFSLLIIGGISNSIIFVFWFKALAEGDTHITANAIYVIPFLALVWTFFLNAEAIKLFTIVGLLLVVTGIIIQARNKL